MNATPSDLLLLDRPQPGCAVLTLNRPQALNALDLALRRALVRTLDALAADDGIDVLIVTGAGRAFCAGLDLKELGERGLVAEGAADDPVAALARFPGPVVGAVHGAAVTGGLELALACDVLVASTQARFADTHARVGVLPGWGLSQQLARRIGTSRAREMAFSGRYIDAATAERWGLVSRVAEPEALLPQALALAAEMTAAAPGMLRAYKRLMDEGDRLALGEALALERVRSREWAQALTSGELAVRGGDAMAGGRQQLPQVPGYPTGSRPPDA